jgi:hypothetical protein
MIRNFTLPYRFLHLPILEWILSIARQLVFALVCNRSGVRGHSSSSVGFRIGSVRVLVTVLVDSSAIAWIDPPLVDEHHEDEIIPECHQLVLPRHLHEEREHIVDNGLEEFVEEDSDGEVRHRVELVVDEQLRDHREEAEVVDGVHECVKQPVVPRGVGVGDEIVE